MYTRTLAKSLKPGDVFRNRGNWCVVDSINVGLGVHISAHQAFTKVKSNLHTSTTEATVRTPLIDNNVETFERCTCNATEYNDDPCDACLLSLTNF